VFGISLVFEGITLAIALREFRKVRGAQPVLLAIKASKDPSTFTVIIEDSAALCGIIVALIGVWLGSLLNSPLPDGIAAVLVGLILAAIACLLARESRGLLIGESADPRVLDHIRSLAKADPAVEHIRRPFTIHFGPDVVLLAMDVQFREGLESIQVEAAVDRIERAIRSAHPEVKYIYLEAESIAGRGRPVEARSWPL
jgi:divalent metal cation (Fe/Co/Zn/Cd) transporter